MKATIFSILSILAATEVAAHATFQQLWVNGVDQGGVCARLPASNSPITSVTGADIRCNAGARPVAAKCSVNAGGTVAVEMHQQPGDRNCANEPLGGAHYGPVLGYLTKVDDASTAAGDGGWFKIYQNTWAPAPGSANGDSDYWGTKDANTCCGRTEIKIPSNIPSGDYILRAEVIALHAASPSGGAQPYVTCFQITVTGGSGSLPAANVKFPGTYSASDPGIGVSIHGKLTEYIAPGGPVIAGGTDKKPGSGSCPATGGGSAPTTTGRTTLITTSTVRTTTTSARTTTTSARATTTSASSGGSGAPLYGQCGGIGWTGPTTCAQGTCKANGAYYSQCV